MILNVCSFGLGYATLVGLDKKTFVEMLDANFPDYLGLHHVHAGRQRVAVFELLRGAVSKTTADEGDIGRLLDGDRREEL